MSQNKWKHSIIQPDAITFPNSLLCLERWTYLQILILFSWDILHDLLKNIYSQYKVQMSVVLME